MISSLSHIALLVPSVAASARFLNSHDIKTEEPETFESEGSKEIYVGSYDSERALLLLVEAVSEGPFRRALLKRGPSLHHLAIDVLNIEEFLIHAHHVGWKLHSASAETMKYKTAWLYLKGIPTLIEIHQKKELSKKPLQVSRIELPIEDKHLIFFEKIGLDDIVFQGQEISLTLKSKQFSFSQLACDGNLAQ